MAAKTIEDDGYLDLEFPGAGPQPQLVRLDLFEAHNTYAHLCDTHEPETQPRELAEAWAAYLREKGCPDLSHGTAFRLAADVAAAVADFKKKHGFGSATADSPASTGSPSAA